MTTAAGEKNTDPPPFAITLDSDLPPTVTVTKPEEVETTAVANGQLKVDGTVGDDFGIDKVRLRMRVEARDLAPVPYMEGQSFLRKKDNTWPTDLEFKLSADLTKLTYADGAKFQPQFAPDKPVVVEFWVEAIDNCTEAKPVEDWNKQVGNVGRSNVQRVTLTPPEMEPEKKQQIDQKKDERSNEEKQHNQQQQQKFDKENREKKPQQPKDSDEPLKNETEQPKKDGEQPKNPDGMPDSKSGDPKGGKPQEPKKNGDGATGADPMAKMPPDPATKPPESKPGDGTNTTGKPDPKMPNDPNMTPKPPDSKGTEKGMDNVPSKGMNPPPDMAGGMGGGTQNTPNPMPMAPPRRRRGKTGGTGRAREASACRTSWTRTKPRAVKRSQIPTPTRPRIAPTSAASRNRAARHGRHGAEDQGRPKPEPMDPMGGGRTGLETKPEGKSRISQP